MTMLIIVSKHVARKKYPCFSFFEFDESVRGMMRREGAFLEFVDANISILCACPDNFLSLVTFLQHDQSVTRCDEAFFSVMVHIFYFYTCSKSMSCFTIFCSMTRV